MTYQGDKVLVSLDSVGEKEDLEVDNILAMVGYRPDISITEELQVRKVNYHVHLLGGLLLLLRFTIAMRRKAR